MGRVGNVGVRPADRERRALCGSWLSPCRGWCGGVGAGTNGVADRGARGGPRELRQSCG